MKKMTKGHLTAIALVITMAIMAPPSVHAFSHIVGRSLGWTVPPKATYYDEWAAPPRAFGVGDKLVFPYRSGQYNVYQVNKSDYDNCTEVAPIAMYARGPTTYYLTKKGDYYFYSGIARHCELNTKLHISVTSDTQGTSGDHFSFELAAANSPAPSHVHETIYGKEKSSAVISFPMLLLGLGSALWSFVLVM